MTQIEVFCKAYSCLDLIINFNPESFSKSISKYISRNEFNITLYLGTDQFEWDLLSNNNPEEFALVYCKETDGTTLDFVRIEQTIRLQIQSFLYFRYYQVCKVLLRQETGSTDSTSRNFLEGRLRNNPDLAAICDVFRDDLMYFPEEEIPSLVDKLETPEAIESFHKHQSSFDRSLANMVETKVMSMHPFDGEELKKSYQKLNQAMQVEHGFSHSDILTAYGLPNPFQ